jgi:phospholipid N-methyltransferase
MSTAFLPFPEIEETAAPIVAPAPGPHKVSSPKNRNAALKCLEAAEWLQKHIEEKVASTVGQLSQPPTRKRIQEAENTSLKAIRLEKYRIILHQLAALHEAGTIDDSLAKLTNHTALLRAHTDGLMPLLSMYNAIEVAPRREISELMTEADAILSRIPGFFPTPPAIIDQLVERLQPLNAEMVCLEPSAGSGRIIDALLRSVPSMTVMFCEFNWTLRTALEKKYADRPNVRLLNTDFEVISAAVTPQRFNRILMNPPFEKGADGDHLMRAYELLAPGGKLAAIISEGPFGRQDKRSKAFQAWIANVNANTSKLPDNSFRPSGTGVSCRAVYLEK